MTSIDDLPPPERKRQREALRRRLAQGGLRPGLLAKFQNTHTSEGKWQFLKSFILDPVNLSGVEVEACYESMEEHTDSSCWKELPLEDLRKEYSTPAQRAFLENSVVGKQTGRDHPQDPTNPDMRLYWVYKEGSDTTANKTSLATRVKATASMPTNKAAAQALHDGMTNFQANFGGKGARAPASSSGKGGVNPAVPKSNPKPKAKKASILLKFWKFGELTYIDFLIGFISCVIYMVPIYVCGLRLYTSIPFCLIPVVLRSVPARAMIQSSIPGQVKSPEEIRKKEFDQKLDKSHSQFLSSSV